jgi:hypothetical protein
MAGGCFAEERLCGAFPHPSWVCSPEDVDESDRGTRSRRPERAMAIAAFAHLMPSLRQCRTAKTGIARRIRWRPLREVGLAVRRSRPPSRSVPSSKPRRSTSRREGAPHRRPGSRSARGFCSSRVRRCLRCSASPASPERRPGRAAPITERRSQLRLKGTGDLRCLAHPGRTDQSNQFLSFNAEPPGENLTPSAAIFGSVPMFRWPKSSKLRSAVVWPDGLFHSRSIMNREGDDVAVLAPPCGIMWNFWVPTHNGACAATA